MKRSAVVILMITLAAPHAGAVPAIAPGECLYLTGAPPGSPSATEEVIVEGSRSPEVCGAMVTMGARGDGTHSVQLNLQGTTTPDPSRTPCLARAWAGHQFRIPAGELGVAARVDISGGVLGSNLRADATTDLAELRLMVVLEEMDPVTSLAERIAERTVYATPLAVRRTELDERFAEALSFRARGDRTYEVRLELYVTRGTNVAAYTDLGPPGTGRGAWYDSIEVCVEAEPEPPVAPADPRIDEMELADLELRLYNKECLPRVWMPAAQSGRLEAARQIVADRIAQATATGDPGVNARVATQKLAAADADIASGQYQRACRSLSDSLRALTTP